MKGVTREARKLRGQYAGLHVIQADVLDVASIQRTVSGQDIVINAIGDDRNLDDPADHVVRKAAIAAVEALRNLGNNSPRLIQVVGAATLTLESGAHMIDTLELEPGSDPYMTINGHKQGWDYYQENPDIRWTLASPSRYIERGERTCKYRVGGPIAFTNRNGELAKISVEDFAVAIIDEAEQGKYVNRQFTVGY